MNQQLIEFLNRFEKGASEADLQEQFPRLKSSELEIILNGLVEARLVDVVEESGQLLYRASKNRTTDYESMVIALLAQKGSEGLWLKDIKAKTNIPHNLILKILRNLEMNRKIKSVKSVKTNRKMYMLYEVQPDEEVTGGVWFNSSDVDAVFVEKLMEIICKYCSKREDSFSLPKLDNLVRISELKDFIDRSKITEVELSINDIQTLVDALVADDRLEKFVLEDGIALRTLPNHI